MQRTSILVSAFFALGNMGLYFFPTTTLTITLAAAINVGLVCVTYWRWGRIVDHTTRQLANAKPLLDEVEQRLLAKISESAGHREYP